MKSSGRGSFMQKWSGLPLCAQAVLAVLPGMLIVGFSLWIYMGKTETTNGYYARYMELEENYQRAEIIERAQTRTASEIALMKTVYKKTRDRYLPTEVDAHGVLKMLLRKRLPVRSVAVKTDVLPDHGLYAESHFSLAFGGYGSDVESLLSRLTAGTEKLVINEFTLRAVKDGSNRPGMELVVDDAMITRERTKREIEAAAKPSAGPRTGR